MIQHARTSRNCRPGGAGMALLAALCALLLACGAPSALAQPPEGATVPAALNDLGEHAEDLYDVINAGNWDQAQADLAWFSTGVDKMDTAVADQAVNKGRVRSALRAVGTAIKYRSRNAALIETNRITGLVAAMTIPYHPVVPAAVARLDFDGRELHIWSENGDVGQLRTTAIDVGRLWSELRPEVVTRGGEAQAKAMDSIVARLDVAKTPAEYGSLATPLQDEVDNLEKVFSPQA